MAVSPDGALVALGGGVGGRVRVHSTVDGSHVASIAGLPRPPVTRYRHNTTAVTYLPDGTLAIGTEAGPLRILDPRSGVELRRLDAGPELASVRIDATTDGRVIGVGPRGTVAWDLEQGRIVWSQSDDLPECGVSLLVESAGLWLCGGAAGRVVGIDIATGAVDDLGMRFQNGAITGLGVSPDQGALFVVGSELIDVWRLDGGGAVRRHLELGQDRFVQEFIGGDRMLVADRVEGGAPINPDVVDAVTGAVIDPLVSVIAATRVGDDPNVLGVYFDGLAYGRYDLATGEQLFRSEDRLPFVPTGAAPAQDRIILWDDTRFQAFRPTEVDPPVAVRGLRAVVVSLDGSRLFTLEAPNLLVQRTPSGEPTGRAPVVGVEAAAATADVVVVAINGRLQVLDAETLEPVGAEFPGSYGAVGLVTIADDGQRMLVNGIDLTVQLADLSSRTFLGDPISPGLGFDPEVPILRALLAPDGRQLAYDVPDGVVIWDLDPDTLRAAACEVAGRDLTDAEWAQYLDLLGARRPLCPG